jgi:PAS domain S-box-containing protein
LCVLWLDADQRARIEGAVQDRREPLLGKGGFEDGAGTGSPEWLRVTLSSIGDAVITTDAHGRVTFLNPIAQALTGWTLEEAVSIPLERVFAIVNEDTRESVESPTARALREDLVVGRANHTLLIAKDGTERPIDDSAAPIRDEQGNVAGVVLVFREISERRRQERATAVALAYAQAIIATLRHPFVVLDAGLRVQSANASFYRGFQVSQEETVNHLIYELGDGQWKIPRLRSLLEELLPSNHSFDDFEVEHDFPRVGRRILLLNARRLQDDQSGGLILLGMEDVTDRRITERALRDSEIRYRRLFQTAKDGILILDAKSGKIIDANAFMSGLLGRELPELLGKELHEIGLFGDIAANKAAFEELRQNGYIRYDHLPVQKPNGEMTQVEFVSNVYREDHRMVAQCNVRDITARSKMEQQIKQQADAMADQHRRKDEFLAMLSHELRNPLAPIRSATHLLRLQERGSENLIQQQAREVIERQVTQLTRLVSDLLEISRVVTGRIRLRLETVDMSQIVHHALETARPLIDRQRHEVSLRLPPEPVWVEADPTRLEEVVVNLLNNAAKYTDSGGQIDLSLEQAENHILLRVRDSGVGIATELLPRIFDLFTQAGRSLDRSQGGLGIGLSLVQRLVEIHGGTVEALSAGLGRGSEFIVRLPVARAPGVRFSEPSQKDEHPVRGLRVLAVDDNVDACVMLAHLLRMKGHGVETAHTGSAALQSARARKPDVVLLDIGLPEIDGYEVARRMRAVPALKNIWIVAITGYGNDDDIQLAREAGFDAHLLKPVDLAELERLLSAWTESRQSGPA